MRASKTGVSRRGRRGTGVSGCFAADGTAPTGVHRPADGVEHAVVEQQVAGQERRPGDPVHQLDGPVLDRRLGRVFSFGERAVDRDLGRPRACPSPIVWAWTTCSTGERVEADQPHARWRPGPPGRGWRAVRSGRSGSR